MVTFRDNDISDILVYGRIERDLRQRIASGEWAVGSAIPGRRRLATQYNVALGTVEHAVAALLADGTLQVVEGRGTFVSNVQPLQVEPLPVAPSLPELPVTTSVQPGVVGIIFTEADPDVPTRERSSEWGPVTVRAIERELAADGGHTCVQMLPKDIRDIAGGMREACTTFPETVEALIVIDYGSEAATLGQALFALRDQAVPLICITWGDLIAEVPHLYFDNRYMGYQAACHLLQAGYSRIVYLVAHTATWAHERYQGICTAVQQYAGMGAEVIRFAADVPFTEHMTVGDYEAITVDQFLARLPFSLSGEDGKPGTTGIIASNDATAQLIWEAASSRGITPGFDYGLLGFDDRPFARNFGLTSLRPPLERMGEEAVHMITRMRNGEHVPNQVRLQADLMPRISTLRR